MSQTAEPIRFKFCVGPRMTQGKVNESSELQKVVKAIDFYKIIKIRKKMFEKPQNLFCSIFILYRKHI